MSAATTLVGGLAARLAWNVEPDAFVFHYTTPAAAQAIHMTGFYVVRSRRPERAGLFVTTIHPGAASSEQLLNRLFDGTRDPERTRAVVVMRRDAIDLPLERETEYGWRFVTATTATLDLRDATVGWAVDADGTWRFDPALLLSH